MTPGTSKSQDYLDSQKAMSRNESIMHEQHKKIKELQEKVEELQTELDRTRYKLADDVVMLIDGLSMNVGSSPDMYTIPQERLQNFVLDLRDGLPLAVGSCIKKNTAIEVDPIIIQNHKRFEMLTPNNRHERRKQKAIERTRRRFK